MKKTNKIISMLFIVAVFMSAMAVASFAEDVNVFPPQRPMVGNMKVAISDDEANIVVGLRTNGTINVLNRGYSWDRIDEQTTNELLSLADIVDVDCTFSDVAALRSDGTVYTTSSKFGVAPLTFWGEERKFKEADSWTDIVAVACGNEHLVGLKADGTVVASGTNSQGQCDVMGWNNVSEIYAFKNTTLAIRKDGTILACGMIDNYGELRKVKNAVEIAPYCGTDKFIVLLNDGTTTTDIADVYSIFAETGNVQKIKSVKSTLNGSISPCYFVLDEFGDLYLLQKKWGFNETWKAEKIEENILDFTVNTMDYYAWNENGQILSDAAAFTSDDWYLTSKLTETYGEDINTFPPQRPVVGNMKVVISDDEANIVVGLRTNGTLNVQNKGFFESNRNEQLKNELLSLTNIVDVDCAYNDVAALRSDGTVYSTFMKNKTSYSDSKENAAYRDPDSWTDIVAIACGNNHLVGLKSDGTVVAFGDNDQGQSNVSGWKNVSKIYAFYDTTLAIRRDGSILATGKIANYSDISKVGNAVDLSKYYGGDKFITLLNDGTTTADIIDIPKLFAESGNTQKIKSVKSTFSSNMNGYYYVLDEFGDLYLIEEAVIQNKNWEPKKIEENILDFTVDAMDYYAWNENGQILSDAAAFTSDDWILTTNITYNGKKVNSDVPPYVKEGRTLAPVRAILESLGMTVSWDGTTQTATAVKGDITISITINSNIAIINGVEKTLDVPAEITNGRTFVPVRFFGEALGMTVDWDSYTKTVIIESK